ncbi:MAG: YraN family protein [Candidatus Omnitrophica bacterium]|nr:YraN family protein [Candidatus Omnitrophota bacterium]
MRPKDLVGRRGEEIARKFLLSRGYRVIERNFKTPFGEIDLIAEEGECTVFFEVKTRISETFGPPSAAVTEDKACRVVKNCVFYAQKKKLLEDALRIDVIAVTLDQGLRLHILKHVRNAIMPEK